MREKVTAMMLFKNRKASYLSSVSHPFRGDYIRLRQNVKWKRLLPTLGDVYVVFADLVSKITKRCGKVISYHVILKFKKNQVIFTMQIGTIHSKSCGYYNYIVYRIGW